MKQINFMLVISILFLLSIVSKAQTNLVQWNFSGNNPSNSASSGFKENANQTINREQGCNASITFPIVDTSSCMETNKWNNGIDTKYWQIQFSTLFFNNISVSSKQYSTSRGPRDFILQYSIDDVNFFDIPNGYISVGSNWTSGVINNLSLPSICNNQPMVYLRWVLISTTSVDGSFVLSSHTSRIDDINVSGDLLMKSNDIVSNNENIFNIFPNPCTSTLNVQIKSNEELSYQIYSIEGRLLLSDNIILSIGQINVESLNRGTYFIYLRNKNSNELIIQKFIKQ